MPQAFRPRLADARVPVFFLDDIGPALGCDARQRELLGHDLGELVHGQLDFKNVLPGRVAGAGAGLAFTRAADRGSHVPRPLADAAPILRSIPEFGNLDLGQGDRYKLSPRLADQLAVRDVLTQVGLDLAPHDLLETIRITIDFSHHG